MNRIHLATGTLLLAALVACGGGSSDASSSTPSSPSTATSLVYTDPSTTGWRLVKDASSTSTHLVLNLVGPSGSAGHGVAFTFAVDPTKATWSKVTAGDAEYVKNVAYNLGSGSQFIKSKVTSGSLAAGVFQKGVGGTAASYNGALVRVALDLVRGQAVNTSIPITVSGTQELTASGMGTITVTAGTLTAQ